jgi:cyanophycin synthetase
MDSPDVATALDQPQISGSTQRWPLPIVGVAGTRGKSTITWLLNAMMTAAGHRTGLWSTSGVFIEGRQQVGELGPWSEVVKRLLAGELTLGVQELETTVVTGVGLPESTYPLAVISTLCGNNDECLISAEAIRGAIAQRIVARAVRADGNLVLNADDIAVLEAAEYSDAAITLFALNPGNPTLRAHLGDGGFGVWLAGDSIVAGDAFQNRVIMTLADAPFTLDGSLSFQVQNLLSAVALALHLGLPEDAIVDGARAFDPSPDLMPGSCNVMRRSGYTILLDAAQHVWTVRSLVRGIRDSVFRRCIVVSGSFPHLQVDQTTDIGRLLGRVADVIVTYSAPDGDASIEAFKDGLAQNHVPPLVFSMPGEPDAIRQALRILGEGDLCLLLTQDVQRALALLRLPETRPNVG